jgi:plasmid replication initiation protein
MYKQVIELVANLQKQFTIIDIENAMRLNSAYAIRFIQILEMIDSYDENYGKRKSFNLAELNAIFGTNYKTIKHIVQNIILPMKQEFDKVSKLTFIHTIKSEANPAGRGRPKATEIMFEIIKNQPRLF